MPDNSFKTGTIKWYSFNKGYGFIEIPGKGEDFFVHAKELMRAGINRSLNPGERVKFIPGKGPKGAFATQISILEG